jgi:hypothetical protein
LRSHLLSQPYFGQVWGWSPTLGKSEDLESFGTPECSELNNKAQNTSHWGVLDVIGKVLERRDRKWPRIGHLDICSPSYDICSPRPWLGSASFMLKFYYATSFDSTSYKHPPPPMISPLASHSFLLFSFVICFVVSFFVFFLCLKK